MLKIFWIFISITLIGIIFFRTPKNIGLNSLTTKTEIFGSPSSTEIFLNNLTGLLIITYFILGIFIN